MKNAHFLWCAPSIIRVERHAGVIGVRHTATTTLCASRRNGAPRSRVKIRIGGPSVFELRSHAPEKAERSCPKGSMVCEARAEDLSRIFGALFGHIGADFGVRRPPFFALAPLDVGSSRCFPKFLSSYIRLHSSTTSYYGATEYMICYFKRRGLSDLQVPLQFSTSHLPLLSLQ